MVFVELPVLGVLGEVVLDEPLVLGEVLLPDVPPELMPELPEVLPDAPLDVPPELEPDLLKCASHSERDTMPSLFVSTVEKLGEDEELDAPALPDEPPALLPWEAPVLPEVLPEAPPEAPAEPDDWLLDDLDCEADGVVALPELPEALPPADWLEPDAAGEPEEDEEEDWATARVDRANSTAALSVLTVLSIT